MQLYYSESPQLIFFTTVARVPCAYLVLSTGHQDAVDLRPVSSQPTEASRRWNRGSQAPDDAWAATAAVERSQTALGGESGHVKLHRRFERLQRISEFGALFGRHLVLLFRFFVRRH